MPEDVVRRVLLDENVDGQIREVFELDFVS